MSQQFVSNCLLYAFVLSCFHNAGFYFFECILHSKLLSGKSLNRNMSVFDQYWKINITEKKRLLPLFLLVRRVHSFFPFLDKAH